MSLAYIGDSLFYQELDNMPDEQLTPDRSSEFETREILVGATLPVESNLLAEEASSLQTQNRELLVEIETLRTLLGDQETTISALAHDLKSPVRQIVAAARFIADDHEQTLGDDGMKWLNMISRAGTNLQALVNDFLDYQRLSAPELRECSLAEIVETVSVLDGIEQMDDVTLEHGELPKIFADRRQIRIVLSNLVNNAIKYKQDDVPPVISVEATETDSHWEIRVSDNGVGIPEEFLEDVFRFTRRLHSHTDIEGQGIGLAACKKIVELHGGKIWVESEVGTGSVFFFTLSKSDRQ